MAEENNSLRSVGTLNSKECKQNVDNPLRSPVINSGPNVLSLSPPDYVETRLQKNPHDNKSNKNKIGVKDEPDETYDKEDTQDSFNNVDFASNFCDVVLKDDNDFSQTALVTDVRNTKRQQCRLKDQESFGLSKLQYTIDIDIVREEINADVSTNVKTKRREKYKYSCDICLYKARTKNSLTNHKLIHDNPNGTKLFACKFCPYATTHRSYILLHERVHTGDKPYSCDLCNVKFAQVRSLSRHKKVHMGKKPFICDVCNRHFAQKYNLVKHLKIHTTIKPYSCDMCRLKFKDVDSLTAHRFTHTEERPYTCDLCQHKFTRRSILVEHIRAHSGEKPYQCLKCGCSFSKKVNLDNHQRIHTGEKPYMCDVCKRNFSQRSNLISHRLNSHPEAKPFTREEGKNFLQRVRITVPKKPKLQTDKPHACEVCQRKFRQKCDMQKHMRIHTGEKPYVCDICECRFTQKYHLVTHRRTHTGEKPYTCELCNHQFTQNSNLNVHKKTHALEVVKFLESL